MKARTQPGLGFVIALTGFLQACGGGGGGEDSESAVGTKPPPPPPVLSADLQNPTIVLTEPVVFEDIVTDRKEIDLAGAASDNVALERVEWSTNVGKTGKATGKRKWLALNVPLGDGTTTITVTAIDTSGNRANRFLRVTYDPPAVDANSPPSLSGRPASTVTAGELWAFTPEASDPDGDPLWFTIQNAPGWAQFDPQTGALWGTPTAGNVGRTENIRLAVTDGIASESLPAFSVTVTSGSPEYSAEVRLDPPTTRVNGSALNNLAGHRIYYGPGKNTLDRMVEIDNPGITVVRIDDLAEGSWFFRATAYDEMGRESAHSRTVRIRL